nr:hypothetical protein Iba_chr06aCG13080 [Ipomoea batatas]
MIETLQIEVIGSNSDTLGISALLTVPGYRFNSILCLKALAVNDLNALRSLMTFHNTSTDQYVSSIVYNEYGKPMHSENIKVKLERYHYTDGDFVWRKLSEEQCGFEVLYLIKAYVILELSQIWADKRLPSSCITNRVSKYLAVDDASSLPVEDRVCLQHDLIEDLIRLPMYTVVTHCTTHSPLNPPENLLYACGCELTRHPGCQLRINLVESLVRVQRETLTSIAPFSWARPNGRASYSQSCNVDNLRKVETSDVV